MSTADDVTAFLADVRMQAEDHHLVPAGMVLPLLAFAEAALKLADDWEQVSALHGYECTAALREAIAAALAGTQRGEDGDHA